MTQSLFKGRSRTEGVDNPLEVLYNGNINGRNVMVVGILPLFFDGLI